MNSGASLNLCYSVMRKNECWSGGLNIVFQLCETECWCGVFKFLLHDHGENVNASQEFNCLLHIYSRQINLTNLGN